MEMGVKIFGRYANSGWLYVFSKPINCASILLIKLN